MFFGLVLVSFATGLVVAQNATANPGERCSRFYPTHLDISREMPDAERLFRICPRVTAFLECEEKKLPQETDPAFTSFFYGIKGVARDICDYNSRLQMAGRSIQPPKYRRPKPIPYLSSRECFQNAMTKWPLCYETGQIVYLRYREFITRTDEENDEDDAEVDEDDEEEDDDSQAGENQDSHITLHEPYCIMNSYALACQSMDILENCGKAAYETFDEITRRSRILSQYCTIHETATLRSKFLDYLAYEEKHPQIEVFRTVFDFRKK